MNNPTSRQKPRTGPKRSKKIAHKVSVARVYKDFNTSQGRQYWDYDNYKINWVKNDPFSVIKKIGRGKYSEVFEGFDAKRNEKCVIKILKPVRVSKVRREIKILRLLCGGPNIVKLLDVCKAPPGFGAMVFEKISNRKLSEPCHDLQKRCKKVILGFDDYEIRYYMYQLAKALDFCHSRGIIHRDVKPGNLIIDTDHKQLRLIDWGLADFYHPEFVYNVRVASRHYKSPELLVKMQMYDYSVDLFAFGVTMLGIVLQKIPFFRGADNIDQLYKIAEVLGTVDLKKYIAKFALKPIKEFNRLLEKDTERVPLESFHKGRQLGKRGGIEYKEIKKDGGLYDLLDKVLLYDHSLRLTAKEVMLHPYFKAIREEEAAQGLPVPTPGDHATFDPLPPGYYSEEKSPQARGKVT